VREMTSSLAIESTVAVAQLVLLSEPHIEPFKFGMLPQELGFLSGFDAPGSIRRSPGPKPRSLIHINAGPPCAVYQLLIAENECVRHMRAPPIDPQELSC
jgi:hypothetical protein